MRSAAEVAQQTAGAAGRHASSPRAVTMQTHVCPSHLSGKWRVRAARCDDAHAHAPSRQDTRGGQARACAGRRVPSTLSIGTRTAGQRNKRLVPRVGEFLTAPSCPRFLLARIQESKVCCMEVVLKIRDLVTVICIAPDGSLYTYHRHDHRLYIRCIATFLLFA